MVFGVGIIGTGIFTQKAHLPTLLNKLNDKFVVLAASSRNKEKLLEFGKVACLYEDNLYTDYQLLLQREDIACVLICVPAVHNLSIFRDATKYKKHILLEKPVSSSLEDARKMVEIKRALQDKEVILVAENWSFKPETQVLKEIAVSGVLGDIFGFNYTHARYFNANNPYLATGWRVSPDFPFTTDAGVHDVAVLTDVLGEVSSVFSFGKEVRKEHGSIDSMCLTLEMKNGVIGTCLLTMASSPPENMTFQIFGTLGTVELRNGKISLFDSKGNSIEWNQVVRVDDLFTKHDSVMSEWIHFYDLIAQKEREKNEGIEKGEGQQVLVPLEKGFHHFAVVIAALDSISTMKKIEVPSA